jgi:cytoskeletal protein RodZ
LPAKHSVRAFSTARLVLSFAVAIMVLLVVWVAVRAVGPAEASRQPSVLLPSMPQVPVGPSPTSSPSLSPAASRSASPSASPSASASSSPPSKRPTSAPTSRPPKTHKPIATSTPSARPNLAGSLTVTASWQQGYVAMARVVNNGSAPAGWTMTVNHSDLPDLRLRGVWGARGDQSGDTLTFTGATLAPGASATFGYQATKSGRGGARPSGCAVVGGTCGMR